MHHSDCCKVLLIVYADDINNMGNDKKGIEELKAFLQSQLHTDDIGRLRYFSGIEVARSKETLVCLKENVLDILDEMVYWVKAY